VALLWRNDSTKYQKIVAAIFSLTTIGPLFLMFTHNFVTNPNVSTFALHASITLTVIAMAFVGRLYTKGLWRPAPGWHESSRLKRILIIPFVPLFFGGMLWINLAISVPQLFTLIFGSEHVRQDVVTKDSHYSRASCDYRLKPKSVSAPLFHYCIPESLYNQLPDTELEAELLTKESALGYMIEDIKPIQRQR